ncbi:MAG: AsmA-like C-terminal domain-containing protein, partial [Desulfohalobiaceae bacterium]|nr:AsmA-like C-terminal domain-containing protein [Desulfohalobiaceae bacterium]
GLFPKEKAIKEAFSIVQKGTLPWARVAAKGKNPDSLLSDLTIRGRLVKGEIDLPMPDIDLESVRTTFSLSKTHLSLANFSAHSGRSEITSGRASLGLGKEVDPISLYMDCRLDLSQTKRLLQRELDLTRVQRELERIESLEGSAKGSFRLTKKAKDLEWGFDLKQLDLETKHKAVSLPVSLNSGQLAYSSQHMRFKELQGQVGQSTFQELGGRIRFGRRTGINLSGKGLHLVLKELSSLLKDLPENLPGQNTLDTLQGRMELERFSLKGPMHKPQQWDFHLAGNLSRLSCTPPSTSIPLEISADSFSGNAEGISWSGFTLTAPQTKIHSEGEASYSTSSGLHALRCSVQGSIRSPDMMDQVYQLLPLPKSLCLKAPLSVSGGSFQWQRNQGLSLQTDFNLAGGTEGHVDLSVNDAKYRINRLRLRHEDKHCILQGGLQGKRLTVDYSGEFPMQALLPAFRHPCRLQGEIEGDFQIRMNTSPFQLLGSNGTVRVRSLKLPERFASPDLVLDRAHVEGTGEDLLLHTIRLQLCNKSIDLSGIVNNTPEGNTLDLKLRAESLDSEWLKSVQEFWNERGSDTSADQARIKGTIELDIGAFHVAGFDFTPVQGTILVKPRKTTILMHKIGLCNFHPHGRVHLSANSTSAEFFARTEGQELAQAISCLGKEEKLVSGEYGFAMNMRTNGTSPSELKGNNRGSFNFQAAEGRIYRINTLAKILALLNTTEILFGNLPDLQQDGMGYHTMNAQGSIQGQVVRLKQVVVNGKSMNIAASGDIDLSKNRMDLIVLVSPLKTVDRIISWIPIVNYILGNKLVSIPFRVSGKIEDPSVSPLPPEAVGSGVLGLIKRTMSLPVHVLQPLMPEEDK